MSQDALFDLTKPRTIVLKDRGRTFILDCRAITSEDWDAYFSGIVVTSEKDGKRDQVQTVDITTPRVALAEAVLADARGYKVDGGAELTSIEGWVRKIPLAHRVRLGETLADVRATESDDFTIYAEGEVVFLDATYTSHTFENSEYNTEIGMKVLKGLKHTFKTPTEAQHRRYTRQASRSKVVGGSRVGRTVYQGAQLLLADLYDELIVSVDGYSIGAVPLTNDVSLIRAHMDKMHKVMAAQELFQAQSTATLAGEDEE